MKQNWYNELFRAYHLHCSSMRSCEQCFGFGQGELPLDHLALRTFSGEKTGLDRISGLLEREGYFPAGSYLFEQKNLRAKHFEKKGEPLLVFVSEYRLTTAPQRVRELIENFVLDPGSQIDHLRPGRPWQVPTYEVYLELQSLSEIAAWISAWGFCANHFALRVNDLERIRGLEQLNELLLGKGFVFNEQGGLIKGDKKRLLRQSSLRADMMPQRFACGSEEIVPASYVEFAERFDSDGNLFRGFIEGNADKIFESTDRSC